jgi:lycopene beta-cyclase
VDSDLVLVGGGLANSLIAYRVACVHPQLRVCLVERGAALGGNHTWSFHEDDLTGAQHAWLAPFVKHSWTGYEVRFPRLTRWIGRGYACITSARLHEVVVETLGQNVLLEAEVASLGPTEVVLRDGRRLRARAVIDGRGQMASRHLVLRYQKFLGQVVALRAPHGLPGPILMDATVPQHEGFRFVYTLPLEERVVLVEDTCYSDTPELDRGALRTEIGQYAARQGWQIDRLVREEEGVLPIVLSGDMAAFWDEDGPRMARSGLRAGLFHPTTGYSLPHAVALADDLAGRADWEAAGLYDHIRRRAEAAWRTSGYFRMLNRMLFLAGRPDQRYRVLERFYRLPQALIARFYAGRLTAWDRLRLLAGAPPVPVAGAVRSVFRSGAEGTVPVGRPGSGRQP